MKTKIKKFFVWVNILVLVIYFNFGMVWYGFFRVDDEMIKKVRELDRAMKVLDELEKTGKQRKSLEEIKSKLKKFWIKGVDLEKVKSVDEVKKQIAEKIKEEQKEVETKVFSWKTIKIDSDIAEKLGVENVNQSLDLEELSELIDKIKYDPTKVVNFEDIRKAFKEKITTYKTLFDCEGIWSGSKLCDSLDKLEWKVDKVKTINHIYAMISALSVIDQIALTYWKSAVPVTVTSKWNFWWSCDLLKFLGDKAVIELYKNPKLDIKSLTNILTTCWEDDFLHYWQMMMWNKCNWLYKDKAIQVLANMTKDEIYKFYWYIIVKSPDLAKCSYNYIALNNVELTLYILSSFEGDWFKYSFLMEVLMWKACNWLFKTIGVKAIKDLTDNQIDEALKWMLDNKTALWHCVYAELIKSDNEWLTKAYNLAVRWIDEDVSSFTDGIENHVDVINAQNKYIQKLFKYNWSQLDYVAAGKLFEYMYDNKDFWDDKLEVGNKFRNFVNSLDDEYLVWLIWVMDYEKSQKMLYNIGRICVAWFVIGGKSPIDYKWDPASRYPCMVPISYITYFKDTVTDEQLNNMKKLYQREDVYLYTWFEDESGIPIYGKIIWPLESYKQIYKIAFVRWLWLDRWRDWLEQSWLKDEFCKMLDWHYKTNDEPLLEEDVASWYRATKQEYEKWCK